MLVIIYLRNGQTFKIGNAKVPSDFLVGIKDGRERMDRFIFQRIIDYPNGLLTFSTGGKIFSVMTKDISAWEVDYEYNGR